MKRLFFICLTFITFWSCSTDTDNNSADYNFEFLPIEEVVIPEEFVIDSVYQIDVTYFRPTNCHGFHDFYYVAEENERIIAIINIVYDNLNCVPFEGEGELIEKSFDFNVVYEEPYVFKFWQGEDENGEDIFLTYEIPVIY